MIRPLRVLCPQLLQLSLAFLACSNLLTVASETPHVLRLEMSLCAFHEVFLSLMPVLIFTVRGISITLKRDKKII